MLVWIGAGLSLVAVFGACWRLAAYLADRAGSQPPKDRPSHARDGDGGVDHSFIPTRFIPTRRSEDILGASGGGGDDGDSGDGGGGDGGD